VAAEPIAGALAALATLASLAGATRASTGIRVASRRLTILTRRFRFTPLVEERPGAIERTLVTEMKSDIHPEYVETQVSCTCGSTFTTRSTVTAGTIKSDVCSQCHPFYTGKQKILDTGGRVARFEARYAKKAADKKPEATEPAES
jgi:large subunit ribosomal protein L31